MNYFYVLLLLTSISLAAQEKRGIEELKLTPLHLADEKPTFPDCKTKHETTVKRSLCFQEKLANYFERNFNAKLLEKENISPKLTLFIVFEIKKDGKVGRVAVTRTSNKLIKEEAIRVMKSTPRMIPAKVKGKPVNVTLTLPVRLRMK